MVMPVRRSAQYGPAARFAWRTWRRRRPAGILRIAHIVEMLSRLFGIACREPPAGLNVRRLRA